METNLLQDSTIDGTRGLLLINAIYENVNIQNSVQRSVFLELEGMQIDQFLKQGERVAQARSRFRYKTIESYYVDLYAKEFVDMDTNLMRWHVKVSEEEVIKAIDGKILIDSCGDAVDSDVFLFYETDNALTMWINSIKDLSTLNFIV